MKLPVSVSCTVFLNKLVFIGTSILIISIGYFFIYSTNKSGNTNETNSIQADAKITRISENILDNGGVEFEFDYEFETVTGEKIKGHIDNPPHFIWHNQIGDYIRVSYNPENLSEQTIIDQSKNKQTNLTFIFAIILGIAGSSFILTGIYRAMVKISILKNGQPVWASLIEKREIYKSNRKKKYVFTYQFETLDGKQIKTDIKGYRKSNNSKVLNSLLNAESETDLLNSLPDSKYAKQKNEIIIYNAKNEEKALLAYSLSEQTVSALQKEHPDFEWDALETA